MKTFHPDPKKMLREMLGMATLSPELRKLALNIALPALAELVFIQLASIVDNAMVGRLGNWALSAVGYTTQPIMLLLTVIQAIHTGATALIARYKGEGNQENANRTLGQTLMLSLLASLAFMWLGIWLAEPLVVLMGASTPESLAAGTDYFRIRMYGLPIQATMLACSASYRGVGKTRITMLYNSIGNILNIFANYALIYGAWGFPAMGVAGAAWATNLGMFVAMSIALMVMFRGSDMLKLRPMLLLHFDRYILRNIFLVGTPAMIEQLFMRLGMLLYMRMVAFGGQDMYAAHIVTQNIMVLTFSNGQAFGMAATTLMGQGVGSNRVEQAEIQVRACSRCCLFVSCCLAAVFLLFGKPIAGLYTTDQATIDLVGSMLVLVALIQPLMGAQLVLAGALRGAGDAKAVTRFSAIGIVGIRPVVCGVTMFLFRWGLLGAWLAYLVDQSYRSLMTLHYYTKYEWKSNIKALHQEEDAV